MELMPQFKKIILQLFEYLTTANKKNIIYFGADPAELNIWVNNYEKLISYQGNFTKNYNLRQIFFMDKMTIRFIIYFFVSTVCKQWCQNRKLNRDDLILEHLSESLFI